MSSWRTKKVGIIALCLLPFLAEFLLGIWVNHRRGIYFDGSGLYLRKKSQTVFAHPANNEGFWGDDLESEKPGNGFRVFLMTELSPMSMRVPRVSQAVLAEALPARRVLVNTMSAPRYTTHHTRVFLERYLLKHKPDVLVMTLGLRDNFYNTMPFQDVTDYAGIYDPFDPHTIFGLRLLRYHLVDKPFRARPDFTKSELKSPAVFESNVEAMLVFLKQHRVPVILMKYVVAFPTEDKALIARMEPMHDGLGHAWGSLEAAQIGIKAHTRILERLASTHGVPLLDPKTVLPGNGRYFKSLNGLTAHGRETYGRFIASSVLDLAAATARTSSSSSSSSASE